MFAALFEWWRVCSLVKGWLRDLAEPLWPQGAPYEEAMAVASEFASVSRQAAEDGSETADEWQVKACARLATVVEGLPDANRAVLHHVCACLRRIDPVATKMTADNLAICWAPCFFRCADISVALDNAKKEIFVTGPALSSHICAACDHRLRRRCPCRPSFYKAAASGGGAGAGLVGLSRDARAAKGRCKFRVSQ